MRKTIRNILTLALLAGLLVYAALLASLYWNQANLVYLPSRSIAATPALIGLDFEDVELRSADGVRLHGWYLGHQNPRATLLFMHGNAGNVGHRLSTLELFHQLGLAVLIIDYRGYGESEGSPYEAGIYRDAEAAWEYLIRDRGVDPSRLILFGRSFGGAIAAYLASRQPHGALVLESTFTSLPEVAGDHFPWVPVSWLTRERYDTRTRLSEIPGPVMIVHSREDEVVPYRHGEALYSLVRGDKRLVTLSGDHSNGVRLNQARYRAAWESFLASL
ncbi:MAG: alpha/beta hydrolase [Candidatus Thiodiazotropha sp.]